MDGRNVQLGGGVVDPPAIEVLNVEFRSPDARYVRVKYRHAGKSLRGWSLWTRGRLRKAWACALCACNMPGGDLAFRPMAACDYERCRVCAGCWPGSW